MVLAEAVVVDLDMMKIKTEKQPLDTVVQVVAEGVVKLSEEYLISAIRK